MSNTAMMMGLSSGAGGVAVADVFSTDLYTGNGSTQDIVNGLDLSTEGGMVLFARRNGAEEKNIFNTYAPNKYHRTTTTAAQETITTGITSYNTDGFSLANWNNVNGSGDTMVSWSWRVAPKFFDVQTWTGDGVVGREIPHNLNGEVGMIWVKSTSNANQWCVYNRNYGGTYFSLFPTAQAFAQSSAYWNDTDATTSAFTVSNEAVVNQSGVNYVAYIFGHGDNIQCGTIVGDGTSDREIDLGFKAQWVLFKRADTNNNGWLLFDAARGMTGNADPYLKMTETNAEDTDQDYVEATDNGFKVGLASSGSYYNVSGQTYIYMAIKAE
tara:strand:- start:2085 stop:3062 length:978 start_codon:yes stop_codon:yes gene_type:complete